MINFTINFGKRLLFFTFLYYNTLTKRTDHVYVCNLFKNQINNERRERSYDYRSFNTNTMRKGLKLALELDQINAKNKYDMIDGYEIHLYGDERDHFELDSLLNKPIFTVHYPLNRCDVAEIAKDYKSDYAKKVFDLCHKHNVGLVIHAESPSFDVFNNPDVEDFCKMVKDTGLTIHVENCYRNIGAVEGLQIMKYMRNRINDQQVFPLLDTCHLIMSEMSFKYEERSFFHTIDSYKSDNFKMHLNDCIGSGEKETGGTHGTNFSNNIYLLRNILWKLYDLEQHAYSVDCILEVDEKDYINAPKAVELANNIDMIMEEFKEEY